MTRRALTQNIGAGVSNLGLRGGGSKKKAVAAPAKGPIVRPAAPPLPMTPD